MIKETSLIVYPIELSLPFIYHELALYYTKFILFHVFGKYLYSGGTFALIVGRL